MLTGLKRSPLVWRVLTAMECPLCPRSWTPVAVPWTLSELSRKPSPVNSALHCLLGRVYESIWIHGREGPPHVVPSLLQNPSGAFWNTHKQAKEFTLRAQIPASDNGSREPLACNEELRSHFHRFAVSPQSRCYWPNSPSCTLVLTTLCKCQG